MSKDTATEAKADAADTLSKADKSPNVEAPKAGSYTLRNGHPTPFRRTITLDGKQKAGKASEPVKVQLTFNPGEDIELSDTEVAGCQDLIDGGLLVPTDRDERGRQKQPPRAPASPHTSADSVIAKLEAKVESQAAELAQLRAEAAKDK